MSAAVQTLRLTQPLRAVRVARPAHKPEGLEQETREREQAAYERGKLDGEKALGEQLLRQRQEMRELQEGVLKSFREAVPQVVRDCEQALTALTLEIARKLVAGLPLSVERVEASLQEALRQVEDTTECHCYVHPDDLDLLRRSDSPLLSKEGERPDLHFHPSPEVSRGGCVVKTRFGVVDAQLESKVQLLKQSLAV